MKLYNPMRRQLILVSLLTTAIFSISGCGGAAEDNYTTTELYNAYDVINMGMSYQLARSAIGAEANSQEKVAASASNSSSTQIIYKWEADKGTRFFTVLTLQIDDATGVVRKAITGPSGNKTQSN